MEGKFSKIWAVYLARLSSFTEVLENVVPFTTANFQKFRPGFLLEWKASRSYRTKPAVLGDKKKEQSARTRNSHQSSLSFFVLDVST